MIIQFALTATVFLFCLAVIYGAICDVRTYTIPNSVSYGLVGLFAIFALLVWLNTPAMPRIEFHVPPILFNVLYGLAVFVFFIVFWKMGWVGGGDAKFVSAISLWMGLDYILLFVIFLALISLALVMVLKTLQFWNPFFQAGNGPQFLKTMLRKLEENAIPYGLPAAVSALVLMPSVLNKVY